MKRARDNAQSKDKERKGNKKLKTQIKKKKKAS